jgi:neopullulanase
MKKLPIKSLTLELLLICSMSTAVFGKANIIDRIDPSNWWVGMKNSQVQLMVHGKNIASSAVSVNYPDVSILSLEKSDNPNYLFVNLSIGFGAKPGQIPISFINPGKFDTIVNYSLLERKNESSGKKGFSSADAIYLITPDRFANGNPNNDSIGGYADKGNRKDPNGRHGGDIKGISQHIDYIKDLGFTAIWINPLMENNMPAYSYHGYAITDFYKIDPRFGSNNDYGNLVGQCHEKGIKVIMDIVLNHCGSHHWWANDLPSSDWYNHSGEFIRTTYRATTLVDPYASKYDKKMFVDGWFDSTMPDLNQNNVFLARYLTQNIIWWIETANIDGIRLDTQPYSEMQFLVDWMKAINLEYPDFTVVGEAWFQYEAFTACYQKNSKPISEYQSEIACVTDFPLCFALPKAVNEKEGWDDGMSKVYNVLAHDFLYGNPMNNMIFLENHDLSRIFETLHGDLKKYKMLVAMLATLRGIPQFYYGSEILLKGDKAKGDGIIRKDMPGGWPGDKQDVFTGQNLKPEQSEAFEYTKRLFTWRKNNKLAAYGSFMQFVPNNGLYVYARYNANGTVLVLVNNNEKDSVKLDQNRYAEVIRNAKKGKDIITQDVKMLNFLQVPAKSTMILELE